MEVLRKMRSKINIMKLSVMGFLLFIMPLVSWADDWWATSTYVQYDPGNIPVIISVPHGGTQALSAIYSICGEYNQDINTMDLAAAIVTAFNQRYPGAKPYIICNKLRRQYFDANRDPGSLNRERVLFEGDNPTHDMDDDAYAPICTGSTNVWTARVAKDAWYAFNDSIDRAKKAIMVQYPNIGKILYLDLHSQTHSSRLVELGYGITGDKYSSSSISAAKNETSLRYLASSETLEDLLRGDASFGKIMEETAHGYYMTYAADSTVHDYKCTPSVTNPNPADVEADYYGGGFNTIYHTIVDFRHKRTPNTYTYIEGSIVDGHGITSGLQVEVPRNYIKDGYDGAAGRKHMGRVLVDTIAAYLTLNYDYTLNDTPNSHYPRNAAAW